MANQNKNQVKNTQKESLTYKQWHGDKIYLNNGAMAFKPLAVDTVLEPVQETYEPIQVNKKRFLDQHTTE